MPLGFGPIASAPISASSVPNAVSAPLQIPYTDDTDLAIEYEPSAEEE